LANADSIFLENWEFNLPMDYFEHPPKRKITPEKAVEILAKHGTHITVDEAKIMLDFLFKFAKLTLNEMLKR